MPRYYFDIDDGDRQSHDDTGQELVGREAARNQAIGVLPDIARDVLPDGDRRNFISQIRDETGNIIFVATLFLVANWID